MAALNSTMSAFNIFHLVLNIPFTVWADVLRTRSRGRNYLVRRTSVRPLLEPLEVDLPRGASGDYIPRVLVNNQ